MGNIRIDDASLREGLRTIRKSSEVKALLDEQVQAIANRAGKDFEGDTIVGQNRCQGLVKTVDKDAYFRELHNHTLQKALR